MDGTGSVPAQWRHPELVVNPRSTISSGCAHPAGTAPPMHVHTREAEAWYLLSGTLTYQAGDERVDLEAGGFIYLPQGLPHAFRTTSAVHYLALTLPGGVMDLYDEVGTPAPERRLPDGGITGEEIARWMAAAPRYGLQVVGPPIG